MVKRAISITATILVMTFPSLSWPIEINISNINALSSIIDSNDAKEVISLIYRYYEAIDKEDPNAILETMYFENTEQEKLYLSQSNLSRLAWSNPLQIDDTIHFISDANNVPFKEYTFLIPVRRDTFHISTVRTIVDSGHLKLICPTPVERLTIKPSGDMYSIELKQDYLAWVNAKNGQLAEKADYHRRKAYNTLKGLEYALANKIQLSTLGEDDIPRIKENYERVMKLSDAQLRERIISRYEQLFEQYEQNYKQTD